MNYTRKGTLFVLVCLCNAAYIAFLVAKTAGSVRSGVASISQDLADSKGLQVAAVVLLLLFSTTFSYVQGIAAKQTKELTKAHWKSLLMVYEWQPGFSHVFWQAQFIPLFVVLVYPVDLYPQQHYTAALIAAVFVWLYQFLEFLRRCLVFNKLYKINHKVDIDHYTRNRMYPLDDVSSTQILIVNFIFLVLLIVFFTLYAVLGVMAKKNAEETTPIAVCEFLFFAGLPLGLVFNLVEVHVHM